MIVQNISADNKKTDVTFTIKRDDLKKTKSLMEVLKSELEYDSILADDQVSKSLLSAQNDHASWRCL